jgi:hypothetical protein
MSEVAVTDRARRALAYADTRQQLETLAAQSAGITSITTRDGYAEAHRARIELKAARVEIEKRGKAAREDAQAFCAAVISAEKELVGIVKPEERRLQGLQDEWDAAREADRKAAEEAERVRVATIRSHIAHIARGPTMCAGMASERIAFVLDGMRALEIGADFAELAAEAEATKAAAIASLEQMLADAIKREAEAAARAAAEAERAAAMRAEAERQAAERAELARLRAEAAAREAAERQRLAAEREAAAAVERAERAKRDAELTEQRRQLEAERAELQRQRDEAERIRREAEAEARRAEAEAKAKREAEEAAAREAERARRSAEIAERQAAEIASATLREAAAEALALLEEIGYDDHIAARKLAAALERGSE